MSFSAQVKDELSHIQVKHEGCVISELSALMRMSGTIVIPAAGEMHVRIDTESSAIARHIYTLIKQRYAIHSEVSVREQHRLGKSHHYMLRVTDGVIARRMLEETGILTNDGEGTSVQAAVPSGLLRSDCCRRAFLRGMFFGGGSISNPEKGYHLEFVIHDAEMASSLVALLHGFELSARMIRRKDDYIVYIKESEHIVDLLNLMGAHGALLDMENIRLYKDIRNQVNRSVNCENANLDKTMNAAERQQASIRVIQERGRFSELSAELREMAELRLENPDATLSELAELAHGISRSGVNHRLRKIAEFAQKLEHE